MKGRGKDKGGKGGKGGRRDSDSSSSSSDDKRKKGGQGKGRKESPPDHKTQGQGKMGGFGNKGRFGKHKGRRQFNFKKIKGQKHFKFNPFKVNSWTQQGQDNFKPEELPVNEFTPEEFVELRTNNTEESAIAQLKEIATELTASDKSAVSKLKRACLICCNNYTKESYKLGVGPINDSVTVAANHKFMGYTVFFLHNPKSTLFLEYLQLFLENTSEYLTVYYTGHGSSVSDRSGDEADGKDEVMIFDDTYIVDDKLAETLKHANGKTKVILINDCCHSGTMYDIPDDMTEAGKLPANIICLSAADDDETAKQGQQNSNDQGFFTFFFFQEVRRNRAITPSAIMDNVSSQLKTYEQCVVVSPTREELMTTPLFPQ